MRAYFDYLELEKTEMPKQSLYFRVAWAFVFEFSWAFLAILVYQTVGLTAVFLNQAAVVTGILFGYILTSLFYQIIGYRRIQVLGFLITSFAAFLAVGLLDEIATVYFLISFIRGIGSGTLSMAINEVLQVEVNGKERGQLISKTHTFVMLVGILAPLIGSQIVEQSGFHLLFLVSGLVSILIGFFPWKTNKKPRSMFSIRELNRISKNKDMRMFSIVLIISESFNTFRLVSFLIIPFIVVTTIGELGVFLSIMGVLSAAFIYITRNSEIDLKEKLAEKAAKLPIFYNIFLALFLNPIGLFIHGALDRLIRPVTTEIGEEMQINNASRVLKEDVSAMSAEYNMLKEVIYYFGRIAAMIFVIVLISLIPDESQLLPILIVIGGFAPIAQIKTNLLFENWIKNKYK